MVANGIALSEGFEPSKDGTHAVLTKTIESSPNDERSYRLLRLNNELEVLLIHDPKADKSAAGLDVHVGHLSDPDNLQGLAHFLEHLLFLGTTKYPRENEYKEFLSLHAGKSNASTSLDHTNYHFEVGHEYLEGALDRFSQFFISPLFNESCKEREIRAVDSEFKRNLQLDQRRLFQIGKHLSSRDHPYWHFGTGNLLTLEEGPKDEGIDSRDELIKFYHKYYSANIMKLVILGRESLDQLAVWAVDKFSDVKNLDILPPAYSNPPLTSKEFLTTVYVKPVKDTRSLEIKFLFPDATRHYTVQPTRYISHLIGHEGAGSILSLLKRKGWANSLSAGSYPGGIGFEFFKVTIDLSREGLHHHEDVAVIVFQYIQLLRQEGVKPYIWDEIVSLASIGFRFKEMTPAAAYVTGTTKEMQKGYAPEWILSGSELVRGNDPNLVMDYINELRVDRWCGQVVSQDPTVVPGEAFTETERWYGVEYHVANVSPSLLKRLEQLEPHPELHFPVPNEYIPKNFETGKVPTPSPLSHPVLVKHTPLARLWHKKDDVFWIPRAHLCFLLRSPMMTMSPSHQARSMLYVELVKDALNEEAYNAEQAGLYYSLSCTIDGVVLKVEGYNDKAHLLLQKIIRTMKTLTIDSGPFWRLKEQMERNLRNSNLSNPNVLAKYYMRYLHQEKMWTYLERLDELEPITPESLQQFYPEMLDRLHIEGLVHGNIDQAQALSIAEIVENGLAPRPLVPSELISLRSLTVPEGCRAVYERDSMDPKNLNSGVDYYVQIEIPASRPELARRTERAVVQILAQIIQEPCFSQLRTIEQLGYIVQSGIHCPGGTHGIRISVQSERDPVHVENRIESFLTIRLATLLETMTEAAYRKQVQSLIKKKLEKDKNLKQETTRYWDQITSGYYDFEETQEDVKEIENITLDMTRIFFQRWVLPGSPQIKKVSVHIRSLNLPPSGEEKEGDELTLREGTEVVKDAVRFKAGLELSRAPYPIVDLLRYSKL